MYFKILRKNLGKGFAYLTVQERENLDVSISNNNRNRYSHLVCLSEKK